MCIVDSLVDLSQVKITHTIWHTIHLPITRALNIGFHLMSIQLDAALLSLHLPHIVLIIKPY